MFLAASALVDRHLRDVRKYVFVYPHSAFHLAHKHHFLGWTEIPIIPHQLYEVLEKF